MPDACVAVTPTSTALHELGPVCAYGHVVTYWSFSTLEAFLQGLGPAATILGLSQEPSRKPPPLVCSSMQGGWKQGGWMMKHS